MGDHVIGGPFDRFAAAQRGQMRAQQRQILRRRLIEIVPRRVKAGDGRGAAVIVVFVSVSVSARARANARANSVFPEAEPPPI
jgi:hypothetical protein